VQSDVPSCLTRSRSVKKFEWTVWITGRRGEIQDGVQDGAHYSIKSSITPQGNGLEE